MLLYPVVKKYVLYSIHIYILRSQFSVLSHIYLCCLTVCIVIPCFDNMDLVTEALYIFVGQNMLQTGLIVGGWDKYEGGKIYGIPLGVTVVEQPFAIGGKILILLRLMAFGFWHRSICLSSLCYLLIRDLAFLLITSGIVCVCVRLWL